MIRRLAEKQIDTNVYGAADAGDKPKRENEQNVKNRVREIKFNAHNQRFVSLLTMYAQMLTYLT